MPGGRTPKLDPDRAATIIGHVAQGAYLTEAAALAGIGESTLHQWVRLGRKHTDAGYTPAPTPPDLTIDALRTHTASVLRKRRGHFDRMAEFAALVKTASAVAEHRAVAHIQNAMAGDWRAAMTYLERRFPHRWRRRTETILTGPGETSVDPLAELADAIASRRAERDNEVGSST